MNVVLLLSKSHHVEKIEQEINSFKIDFFDTYADLDELLTAHLQTLNFSHVIHTAAVSDYSVIQSVIHSVSGKIESDQDFTLHLKRNPKLISKIKEISQNLQLIGFKLTDTKDKTAILGKVRTLIERSKCDFVVQNDMSNIRENRSIFRLYDKKMQSIELDSVDQLCYKLFENAFFDQAMEKEK